MYDYLPFNESEQLSVQPIYKTLSGWNEPTFGITKWENLPIKAQEYVLFLEALMDTKISIISTGPERSQTIDRKNLLSSI
jgi:adenylosuccinate synthase